MADEIDQANRTVEQQRETSTTAACRAAAAIPAGRPGECLDCGEESPRLVGGSCAFCRDGRPRH